MSSFQIKAILNDESLKNEIRNKLLSRNNNSVSSSQKAFESMLNEDSRGLEKASETNVFKHIETVRGFEAIVERFGRPSLLIKNGTFEVPPADTWKARLYPTQSRLNNAIQSVGRVELINHSYSWAGTAWIIAGGIAVTNRHVANLFAQKSAAGFSFLHNPLGEAYGVKIDFKEEHLQLDVLEIEVEEVLYVADNADSHPDLAFLKLKSSDSVIVPPPIPLYDQKLFSGQTVAVIGYPAYDDRNDSADMMRIFDGVYGVKRFAPGEIRNVYDGGFTHDCTTLGGNSGSVVVDVSTGKALGLHFAGEYLRANFAVSASRLREFLEAKVGINRVSFPVPAVAGDSGAGSQNSASDDDDIERPQPKIEDMFDRNGYDSGFLGDVPELNVPLPELSADLEDKAVVVDEDAGDEKHILKYTNFSVVMNGERKFAFYTATNIDGSKSQRVKRKSDSWSYDPRISRDFQVGNELYSGNDLDRGHLTRRLDPAWGNSFELAEKDTFFFTNCTPQHHLFNTKTWLKLEDYILDNTDTKDFRACVFTGPVFSPEDRPYEYRFKDNSIGRVFIPLRYWKIVVMINSETGKLSATAYTISQKDLISNLEFVFGQFKTYQLPIRSVENLTGLDFGNLKKYDPLKNAEGLVIRELHTLNEVIL